MKLMGEGNYTLYMQNTTSWSASLNIKGLKNLVNLVSKLVLKFNYTLPQEQNIFSKNSVIIQFLYSVKNVITTCGLLFPLLDTQLSE